LKISVDTNVLVRNLMNDDPDQARAAAQALEGAELIAASLSCLCEFVWVLRRVYRLGRKDVLDAINALLNSQNVVLNRAAVEAGLTTLMAGGDFADGVIAYEGRMMGGETFVSFDKKAVSLLAAQGKQAKLLS
jgi:predicted nucleic-acid-binding protein